MKVRSSLAHPVKCSQDVWGGGVVRDEAGVTAGPSHGDFNAWPRPKHGACYSQMRWAGLGRDAGTKPDYEFPNTFPG